MGRILALVACLLLTACQSYTEQQGIITVPTGDAHAPMWLWLLTFGAVVALVVAVVLVLRGGGRG